MAAVLVPVADLALVLTGVLDVRRGVLVAVLLEVVLAGVVEVEVRAFRRTYRAARAGGRQRRPALYADDPRAVAGLLRTSVG